VPTIVAVMYSKTHKNSDGNWQRQLWELAAGVMGTGRALTLHAKRNVSYGDSLSTNCI